MYTMCPPGCYHNGFMATPELGHRMYGYYLQTVPAPFFFFTSCIITMITPSILTSITTTSITITIITANIITTIKYE